MPLLDDVLDASFSTPIAGTDLGFSVPATFGAMLDGHPLVVDTKQYRRRTMPATRVGQDSSAIPGEQALNNEVYWTRTQRSWTFGSGQTIFDSADSGVDNLISRQRAEEIWNLDIDNADGIFVTDFTVVENNAINLRDKSGFSVTTNIAIVVSDTYAYYIDYTGLLLYRLNLVTGVSDVCDTSKQYTQLTTDGARVYAATESTQIVWVNIGSLAVSNLGGSTDDDSIFFGNGFLFAGKDGALAKVDSSGTHTTLVDLSKAGSWGTHGWASSPEYVYAVWCDQFGRTTVYKTNVDSNGLLTVPTVALPPLNSETIQCLLWHQGVMLIGTNLGFHVGVIDSGNISLGPLLEVNRDRFTSNVGIRQFAEYNGKVWFPLYGIYNARNDEVPSTLRMGTAAGVGTVDLGHSVDSLQPAVREVWRDFDIQPIAIVGTANQLAVFGATAVSILTHNASTSHPVTSGSFSTGWITFGIDSKKTFIDVDLAHDPLTTGQSIEVWLQEEDVETPVLLGESSTIGTTSPVSRYPVGNISSNRIRLIFVLNGDVETPFFKPTRLRRWMLRAYPMPKRVDEIIVPVIMHREVRTGVDEGGTWFFDVLAEWQHYTELATSGDIVFYQEGGEVYRVKVDSVEIQPDGWTTADDGAHYFFDSLMMVRLLTLD
jgi:hypothetical protein